MKNYFEEYDKIMSVKQPKPKSTFTRRREDVNKVLRSAGMRDVEEMIAEGKKRERELKWLESQYHTKRFSLRSFWVTKFQYDDDNDPREINIVNLKTFTRLITKRLFVLSVKNQKLRRLITLGINQKRRKFEYRKQREERLFYKTLVKNLRLQMVYPFYKKSFYTRLPRLTKPVIPYRLVRKRFLQPIYIRLKYLNLKPHNGLRLKKKRRL